MTYVKKIGLIAIAVLILISGVIWATDTINQRRNDEAYRELAARYSAIAESNTNLREANIRLIASNQQLREEQQRSAELIRAGQVIIGEFQAGISDSYSALDRIEAGLSALERLVGLLYQETEKN